MIRIAEGGVLFFMIRILFILNKLKTFKWKYNQPHKHVSHISIKERRGSGGSD